MSGRYLACDLGAESGRVVAGALGADGRLAIQELHRFPNGAAEIGGRLDWDITGLYRQILDGLTLAAAAGVGAPDSVGVDTWGVDFGLLDERGELVGSPLAYRDARHPAAMAEALEIAPRAWLFERTGCQVLPINSVFQLYGLVADDAPALRVAHDLLFLPDLFNHLLSRVKAAERSVASTSGLLDPRTGDWADEVFDVLGLPRSLVQRLIPPGTVLGPLTANLAARTGLGPVSVVAVAGHDTASAVAAVPAAGAGWAFLSSGTWSLLGIESPAPVMGPAALAAGLTNEAGLGGRWRVLRNIAGLWLLRECRRAWSRERAYTYDELVALAAAAPPLRLLIDPDHPSFLNPPDMPAAIAAFGRAHGEPVPATVGETARCVLDSLALAYRRTLARLRAVTGAPIDRLHVIGGGARNALLCQLTADATGLPVLAGPVEATAVGNLLTQAIALGDLGGLDELRAVVRASFAVLRYEPRGDGADWDAAYDRFLDLIGEGESR